MVIGINLGRNGLRTDMMMMLALTLVLMVAAFGGVRGAERKQCQEIKIPMCKGIGYNYTYMPNQLNHDTQDEAGLEVHQFWPLVEIKCSPDLKLFLCSMYAPICLENYRPHLPACRSLCERAKTGCAPLMRQYGFVWPERMDCSKLPVYGEDKEKLCMDPTFTERTSSDKPPPKPERTTPSPSGSGTDNSGAGKRPIDKPDIKNIPTLVKDKDKIKDMGSDGRWDWSDIRDSMTNNMDVYKPTTKQKCVCECTLQQLDESSAYYNTISSGGIANCAMNCTSPYFSKDEQTLANLLIGILSIFCCISTAATVLTFMVDVSRFKYPQRPIIFFSGCYFMVSIGYIVRLVFGHEAVACDGDMIRYSTVGPASCVATFLLVYFFSMAASIWWVILAGTWFLSAGKKWGSEAIASYSQYFHLAAWLIPTVKTIVILATSSVDGDTFSGICFVGNQNLNNLRGFVLIPLCLYLIIGTTFLVFGFVSLLRIRKVIKSQNGGKTDQKLERLMKRIGVFSLVYTILASCVIACYIYEQDLKERWEKTLLNCNCFDNPAKPDFSVFMVKYVMSLAVGIFSGCWIWTSKTVDSWKKLCNGSLCCRNSDYAYSRPPIKYSPTSNSAVSSLHKSVPISHC